MKLTSAISKRISWPGLRLMALALLAMLAGQTAVLGSATLQGQNKGDTNTWTSVNLQGWVELDYIPFRVYFFSGSMGSQTITITFDHLSGTIPGFEDLTSFTTFTTNVIFTSAPVLTTDPSGIWKYTFTAKVLNNNPAQIRFLARLAAGSHLNGGSSLHLNSTVGNVQIHKAAAGPGAPDLAITKTGPASKSQGSLFTYSLSYTNKAATNTAVGTQILDILPLDVTLSTNSLPLNSHLVGNTLFFDLTNLAPKAHGIITFQAQVTPGTTVGEVLTNFSQILSSENDANMLDNTSTWLTTVGCTAPSFSVGPYSSTNCPGDSVTFSVVGAGSPPLTYQWRKNGTPIAGAAGTSYFISSVAAVNSGSYDVVLSNGCGVATSVAATLKVNQNVTATPLTNLVRAVGSVAIFSTAASGTGPITFVWTKDGGVIPGQNASTLVLTNLAQTDSGLYSVIVSGACNSVTNSATLTVDTCFPAVDVMLAIDRSGSMTGESYNDARQACSNFVANLHLGTNLDQAGLASYNSTATLDQTLTTSLSALNQAIHSIPAAFGNTSISLGLQTAETELVSVRHNPQGLRVMVLLSGSQPTGTDTPSNALAQATIAKNAGTLIFTVGLGTNVDGTLLSGIASAPGDYYFTTNSSQLTALFNAISTVICRPPTNIFVTGPSNVTACFGSTATFSVTAAGCDSYNYQWRKDGGLLQGATNSSLVISNVALASAGTYSIEVTSACKNVTNSAVLTVTPPPTIFCASNKTVQVNTAWTFDAPTASGSNVTIVALTPTTNTIGHCGTTFDATETWVATDICGNTASCSQKVTVVDTTVPVITCTSTNKTVEQGTAWSFDVPTATDNSGSATITVLSTTTNFTDHCGTTFDATRVWVATDGCSNTASCSQKVTVVDTTAPVITCSSTNKTVEQGTAWTFDMPTATDNSGTATITVLSTTTNFNGHCGTTFDATRVWVATDGCSNTASCSQKVTVEDTTAPVIACINTNKIVQEGTPWDFDPPTATDNSGSATITVLSTTTNFNGHCGTTFDATRTWLAVDACSNTASCSQNVNVVSTTAPLITCANTNKTVEQGVPWDFDPPIAASSNVTISVVGTATNTAGHCGTTFDATRTWMAMDACANTAFCSQKVTVVDTTAPVITCSSTNKTVEQGTAWTFDTPTATDNSGSATITVLSTTTNFNGHCGTTFDATRVWVATDGCSNTASCSQKVTVVDTTAPVISCTSTNKTVEQGTAWTFDAPTATDNSGTATITVLSTTTNFNGHCGTTFDATRVWVATDGCSNTASCSQKVTVVDTTAPVITCSSTNKTVEQGTAWIFDAPTATDNSGTATITVLSTTTNFNGHCGTSFDATRTWLATDACSNTASCSQKVTVVDTTVPVITCTSTNKTVEQGTAWSFDVPTATDNSGSATITVLSTTTNFTDHCGTTFDATRVWVATDGCSNTASCSQKVTVVDTTAPVITCSSTNKTVEQGTAWTFDMPTATDNSGTATITVLSTTTNFNGHCGTTFDATRVWVATDGCSNTASCSQKVTVEDTTAPVIACINTNKIVQEGTPWDFDPPTATDNSGSATITVLSTTTNFNGHCGTTFDATRTWLAVDACSNTASCSQNVNVVSTTAPLITCANTNKTVEQGVPWDFDPPIAASSNVTISVVGTATNTAGHCGTTFDATRTWMAMDACANTAFCSQKVTVVDTTAPVITCSSTNKTVEQGTAWTFDTPTATDNSGSATITVLSTTTNFNGHCGTTFDATRVWVATDGCSNTASCSQKVTVVDTTAPVISCTSTNKTVEQGTAWTFDAPTATDNSGTATITVLSTTTNFNGHCGTTFDATRVWVATDGCSNTASCSQKVTVVDTTAPVITCSSTNKTVEQGTAWIFDAPTATDNSGTATITVLSTTTNFNGHCGTSFDATRTWLATDACSNTASCSQKVTVVDTTVPVITCTSTNKTVEQGTAWSFDVPTATDNSGSATITVLSTTTNFTDHCGTTFDATRVWVATDGCSNTASCSQKVTVVDTTAPVITCSSTNKTVEQGTAWTFDMPTATDNSGTATITVLSTTTNFNGHCGTTFDATRVWVATDGCSNTASCSQKVTVEDTTAPVIACINTNKIVQEGTPWDFDPPTATDNSGSATITVLSTTTNFNGHCGTTFDATRTWLAVDACSNTASCSQNVNVVSTTAPLITCANTNKTVEQGVPWDFDPPIAASSNVTISVVGTATNTAGHCGTTFDATRTWMAMDACANTAFCSQKVTVVDTTAPVITCSSTNKTVEQGTAWTFDTPTATDNSGSATITVLSTTTNFNGHCGTTFDATRVWVATDGCSNTASCSQKVTVVDTTAPVISCTSTNKTVEQGTAWTFDAPTATDNSGTATITVLSTTTNFNGHCGTTFDATRVWVATDGCSNTASCSQKVTVVDTTAPVITCSSTNKTVEQGTAWIFDAPTATDNSGTATITVLSTTTNFNGHCGTSFDATRTWLATDACSNTASCSQKVTVVDTTVPVITCTSTNKTVEQGTAWTFDAPTATDNSGTATITIVALTPVTNTVGHCGVTFDTTETWVATDACGNSASCSQKVTVVDTTAPTVAITSPTNGASFLAPANLPILATAQDVGGVIEQVEFLSGTNSLGIVSQGNPYSVLVTNLGVGTYILKAISTDGCGHMATSAPVTITVRSSLPLAVTGPLHLNFQTGFWEQTAHISNPTPFTFSAVGVLVENLPFAWRVQNTTLTTNGIPVVLYNQAVGPGPGVDITIKYFLGAGASTNTQPLLVAMEMAPVAVATAAGTQVPITRWLFLHDGTFLLNFNTVAGGTYEIQYSTNLTTWKAALSPVSGTGFASQWIDYGPPVTTSLPKSTSIRFYRVIRTQ